MTWTEERVELLKELWGNGKTAADIAEALGGVTRNAVIGKANRLNLSAKGEAKPASVRAEPSAKRPCQWPIGHPGEPDFRFCNKEAAAGKPYCVHHCNLAYQNRDSAAA
ncbi:GcrA family cell cycle regulator [Oceanibacterium hippocampi]|uniref:GcrA cell cycle regulator n=1 Tax=Oceanibacterium hippocampi TaxID=745714 RepID=A0A1Y5RDJ6_9PROT|nr:GcrA family cell cycle regulator [Oceanibacterium hippocampi]SLN12404.1 GcrA cell cycle regulator [Oceanibacterium hippocampi]